MSLSATAFVELVVPHSSLVWCFARVYLESMVDSHALLCHPWGDYDPREDDGPPPIVKPRGVPGNMGSIPTGEYALYVTDEPGERYVAPKAAKKLRPFRDGYVIDPDVKVATWLTSKEVLEAADQYKKLRGNDWYELRALCAMMVTIEKTHYVKGTEARLVLWFK